MDRKALLAPIVKAVQKETGEKGDFEHALKEWDAIPLIHAGLHIGTFIAKGTEVHFALADGVPSGSVRKAVRDVLSSIMEQYGFLTTKAPLANIVAKQFIKRIGFSKTWKDENYQYYMLTELPWSKLREV